MWRSADGLVRHRETREMALRIYVGATRRACCGQSHRERGPALSAGALGVMLAFAITEAVKGASAGFYGPNEARISVNNLRAMFSAGGQC